MPPTSPIASIAAPEYLGPRSASWFERSVIKIQDWTHKSDRLQKIIAEAARQSLNPQPPHLETPKTVREFVANTDKQRTFFAHIGNYPRPSQIIPNLKGEIRFLIGPEGGFSPTETDFLLEHASPISLGHNILRAETAAIACAMTHLLCS
jgi:16S rRNA (uracil1498-N3)-methyltransferase